MKILFISDYYPPYIKGGAEISTSLLAHWLSRENSVSVACSRITEKEWVQDGVSVYPIIRKVSLQKKSFKSILGYGFGIIFAPLLSAIQACLLVHRLKPEVVNAIPSSYQFIPVILAVRIFCRVPIVTDCRDASLICPVFYGAEGMADTHYSTHGYRCLKSHTFINPFLNFFIKPFAFYESSVFNIYKSLLKFFSSRTTGMHFVAVSEFMRGQLLLNGFQSDRVSVIYNIAPVYNYIGHEKIIRNIPIIFAYAGRIEKEKGVYDIIKAAKMLRAKNFDLTVKIVGTGSDFGRLQKYIQEKKLAYIHLFGKITPDEVLDLYATSSVILGPSRSPEPFGRFILESLSVGKPLIATRSGGSAEGVENGATGLLIDVGNVRQLALAMEYFITNPEKINIMEAEIIKKSKNYQADRIGAQRLGIYKNICDSMRNTDARK